MPQTTEQSGMDLGYEQDTLQAIHRLAASLPSAAQLDTTNHRLAAVYGLLRDLFMETEIVADEQLRLRGYLQERDKKKKEPAPAAGMLTGLQLLQGQTPTIDTITLRQWADLGSRGRRILVRAGITHFSELDDRVRWLVIFGCGPVTTRQIDEWRARHQPSC